MCRQKQLRMRLIGTNVLSIGIPSGLDKAFATLQGMHVCERFAWIEDTPDLPD
jgi:hypothetical protein